MSASAREGSDVSCRGRPNLFIWRDEHARAELVAYFARFSCRVSNFAMCVDVGEVG